MKIKASVVGDDGYFFLSTAAVCDDDDDDGRSGCSSEASGKSQHSSQISELS